MTRRRVDFTQGPMLQRLVALSWPLFVGNILTTFYNLADMWWVSQVSTEAAAAISITFPTVWLTFSLGLGVTIAGVAFVSQHVGAGEPKQAARVAGQVVVMAALAAVVLGGTVTLLRFPLLKAMGADGLVLEHASTYLLITLSALPFKFIFFAYRSVAQGSGDGKTPRNLLAGATLFNVILDPFLIFGWAGLPAMGVAGAAWATWIAELIGAVISLYFLFQGRLAGVRLTLAHLKPDLDMMRRIAAVGFGGSLDMGSRGLSSVVVAGIVSRFGVAEAAAYGIVMRIMSVVWTSSGAMEQAVSSSVGQNLGAHQPERAERSAWIGAGVMFAFLFAISVGLYFFADEAVGLFRVSEDVVATGARFVRLHVLSYGFSGAMDVLLGGFRGAGRTIPPAVVSFSSRWLVQIPLAILVCFTLGHGADGYWRVFFWANVFFALLTAAWFRQGQWKRSLIDSGERSPA